MTDVLSAMRVAEAYCYDAGAANAARNAKEARETVSELLEAAQTVANPAASDVEIFNAAPRLRAAIAKCKGEQP